MNENKKQLLIFEYITGGGYVKEALPKSLAKEGLLMLQALVQQLASEHTLQIMVLLDSRIKATKLPENINIIFVSKKQNIYQILASLLDKVHFVWPIVPEMQGELKLITQIIEQANTKLLNSSADAISICSDKLQTINCLKKNDIAVVTSLQFDQFKQQFPAPWVVKLKDGVGCLNNYFIQNQHNLIKLNEKINNKADFLIQPYINGEALSLSCLFKNGKAWLLCCNKQQVIIHNGQFELKACTVNSNTKNNIIYQDLINRIAMAIPGLFAYVGIDIMLAENGEPLVLEINPRLTTSFVGISQAIGFNVAITSIEMLQTDPIIKKTKNNQVTISIV